MTVKIEDQYIDLWLCRPNQINDAKLLKSYREILPEVENKIDRYKFAHHRHDALVTRVFLRDTLSKYHKNDANDWVFSSQDKGKPYIKTPKTPLAFNLSHTENLIICAVVTQAEIGCDVENCKRDNAILEIANRYFAESEVSQLNAAPKNRKVSRFFDFWTLKESFIKTTGQGLSTSLKAFSFEIEDKIKQQVNTNIDLFIDEALLENAEDFFSILFYLSKEHRIAVTIKGQKKLGIRIFETTPRQGFKLDKIIEFE